MKAEAYRIDCRGVGASLVTDETAHLEEARNAGCIVTPLVSVHAVITEAKRVTALGGSNSYSLWDFIEALKAVE